jgi:ABC-2 type transport system permease protein
MTSSLVPILVRKDLRIMRVPSLLWWAGGLLSVVLVTIVGERAFLFSFIIYVACMLGAGVHTVMQTVVEERRDKTLAFVMSLPITVREYTTAKLLANVTIFGLVWLTLSAATYLVFLGDGHIPPGAVPFVTILLVQSFVAFTLVLAVSLVSESMGWSVASTVAANLGSQLMLWWVTSLPGVAEFMGGDTAVWSRTIWTVLIGQSGIILALLLGTYSLQARKTDFI